MKQFMLALTLFYFSGAARADLLDRLRLEEALKDRVEDAFRLYDPKAQVLVRLDYKSFQGALPGTTIETRGEVNPFNIDSGDITRINVEIFTDLEDVVPEAKSLVLKAVPLEKSKISVDYKKLKTSFPKEALRSPLDPQALSTIARDTMDSFMKIFGVISVGGLLLFLAFLFQQNSRKLKEFKQQVQLLTTALSEHNNMPPPMVSHAAAGSKLPTGPAGEGDKAPFKSFSPASLQELFADCYWCREDAYAHWLWRQLESPQRSELLNLSPLLKDYSLYFVSLKPLELSYHDHPYYLDPRGLSSVSQEDLCAQIRGDLGLWHFLSPMRQQNLPLSLEERLGALQSKPEGKKTPLSLKNQSPLRVLETKHSWGELSSEDEETLFRHPEMVPSALRENIHSLAWLAQKENSIIQNVLSRYDARSLASAWVGPESVLKKLEAQLPEKKLKVLLSYLEKSPPSRHSDTYASLVAESFKHDAA